MFRRALAVSFAAIVPLLLVTATVFAQSFSSRPGTGPWYRGFEVVGLGTLVDIRADIVHFRGGDTGSVSLSIYAGRKAVCSRAVSRALCNELKAAADASGAVRAKVTGARVARQIDGLGMDDFLIAFRLPGDRADRLMVIEEQATERGAYLYHPKRGQDFQGYVKARRHLCEVTTCADEVFRDVRRNPAALYGSLDGIGWTRAIRERGRSRPTARDAGRPAPSDSWTIFKGTDRPIGEVRFSPGPQGLAADGRLEGIFRTGTPHETEFVRTGQTDEAVTFAVTVFAGQSGERRTGHLVVELPSYASGNPSGTLILGDEVTRIFLAPGAGGRGTMKGAGGAGGGTDPSRDRNPDFVDPDEPRDELPVIGVYRYDYRLRDVPDGRSLYLRREPTRDSTQTGTVSNDTPPMQMVGCRPHIDSSAFHDAPRRRQLALLSGAWCEVQTDRARGWVPGIYLQPAEPLG